MGQPWEGENGETARSPEGPHPACRPTSGHILTTFSIITGSWGPRMGRRQQAPGEERKHFQLPLPRAKHEGPLHTAGLGAKVQS